MGYTAESHYTKYRDGENVRCNHAATDDDDGDGDIHKLTRAGWRAITFLVSPEQ